MEEENTQTDEEMAKKCTENWCCVPGCAAILRGDVQNSAEKYCFVIPQILTTFFMFFTYFYSPSKVVVSDEISAERYFKIPHFSFEGTILSFICYCFYFIGFFISFSCYLFYFN